MAGLCVLRGLFCFVLVCFFLIAVFFPASPEKQVKECVGKPFLFSTKVNKILAPEHSQENLAPKLILIRNRSKLTCYVYGWLSEESKTISNMCFPKILICACIVRRKNPKDYVSSFYLHQPNKSQW